MKKVLSLLAVTLLVGGIIVTWNYASGKKLSVYDVPEPMGITTTVAYDVPEPMVITKI